MLPAPHRRWHQVLCLLCLALASSIADDACVDQDEKWASQGKTCADMKSLCDDAGFGKLVRKWCPRSCGLCGSSVPDGSNESSARDSDAPQTTSRSNDTTATTTELNTFRTGRQDAGYFKLLAGASPEAFGKTVDVVGSPTTVATIVRNGTSSSNLSAVDDEAAGLDSTMNVSSEFIAADEWFDSDLSIDQAANESWADNQWQNSSLNSSPEWSFSEDAAAADADKKKDAAAADGAAPDGASDSARRAHDIHGSNASNSSNSSNASQGACRNGRCAAPKAGARNSTWLKKTKAKAKQLANASASKTETVKLIPLFSAEATLNSSLMNASTPSSTLSGLPGEASSNRTRSTRVQVLAMATDDDGNASAVSSMDNESFDDTWFQVLDSFTRLEDNVLADFIESDRVRNYSEALNRLNLNASETEALKEKLAAEFAVTSLDLTLSKKTPAESGKNASGEALGMVLKSMLGSLSTDVDEESKDCPDGYEQVVGQVHGYDQWTGNDRKNFADSSYDCSRKCGRTPGCGSFEYSNTSKRCYRHSQTRPTSDLPRADFVMCRRAPCPSFKDKEACIGPDAPAGHYSTEVSLRPGSYCIWSGGYCQAPMACTWNDCFLPDGGLPGMDLPPSQTLWISYAGMKASMTPASHIVPR